MQDSIEYILQILPQMLEGLKITIKLFVVTLILTFGFNYVEKRLSISEQGVK